MLSAIGSFTPPILAMVVHSLAERLATDIAMACRDRRSRTTPDLLDRAGVRPRVLSALPSHDFHARSTACPAAGRCRQPLRTMRSGEAERRPWRVPLRTGAADAPYLPQVSSRGESLPIIP